MIGTPPGYASLAAQLAMVGRSSSPYEIRERVCAYIHPDTHHAIGSGILRRKDSGKTHIRVSIRCWSVNISFLATSTRAANHDTDRPTSMPDQVHADLFSNDIQTHTLSLSQKGRLQRMTCKSATGTLGGEVECLKRYVLGVMTK